MADRNIVEAGAGAADEAGAAETAKKTKEQLEKERRKKEEEAWALACANYYSQVEGAHPGFKLLDENLPPSKGLQLQTAETVTGLFKDGTYQSNKHPEGKEGRKIILKNGSVTTSPNPQTKEEYIDACYEMMMFVKQGKGKSVVTFDVTNPSDITEVELQWAMEAAKKAGVTLEFGPNINNFLESNQTNVNHSTWKRLFYDADAPVTLKTKQIEERKERIKNALKAHNDQIEVKSLEERGKIQEHNIIRYNTVLNDPKNPPIVKDSLDPEEAEKTKEVIQKEIEEKDDGKRLLEEQVTVLENKYDQIEKQLTTVEHAKSHLKVDMEFFDKHLDKPEKGRQAKEVLDKTKEPRDKLLITLTEKSKDIEVRYKEYGEHLKRVKDGLNAEKAEAAADPARLDKIEANIEKIDILLEKHKTMKTSVQSLGKDLRQLNTSATNVHDKAATVGPAVQRNP